MLFERDPPKLQKLLVVEDDPLIAFDNEHFLASHGYIAVDAIDTAAKAEAMIAEGGIDLVLLDVHLNNSDGRDVALAARDAGIPVLFVTANCPDDAQEMAIGCLAKPYTQKELLQAIEAVTAKLDGKQPKRKPRGLTLYP